MKFCKIEKEDTLITLLSAWDRLRDSTAKRNLSKHMQRSLYSSNIHWLIYCLWCIIKKKTLDECLQGLSTVLDLSNIIGFHSWNLPVQWVHNAHWISSHSCVSLHLTKNQTLFNIIHWVSGLIVSSTKRLMVQILYW